MISGRQFGFCLAGLISYTLFAQGESPNPGAAVVKPLRAEQSPYQLRLVEQFDQNGNQRLDAAERQAARAFIAERNRPDRNSAAALPLNQENEPTTKLRPVDVRLFPNAPLYGPRRVRTFFLDFENADWESELADFSNTDVNVPARLTVDNHIYPNVGVHFRGGPTSARIGDDRRHSINVLLDFVDEDQRLYGFRMLNLLSNPEDASHLRAILYCLIAREFIPAAKANFARVVLNGENRGIYVNVQQFNKDFIREWFGTTRGARWRVYSNPQNRGGLEYLGEDINAYKRIYEIRSMDDPKAWADLIQLCKTLHETSTNKLEEALAPLLDIDGTLKFLALENALINNDGYWARVSNYSLYEEESGRFHLIPHAVSESFRRVRESDTDTTPQGVELDPLRALNDASKPLLAKLLSVPELRVRYLGYVRQIADRWLDWNRLGVTVKQYQTLLTAELDTDNSRRPASKTTPTRPTIGSTQISLENFAAQRRAFLLHYTAPNSQSP